MEEEKKKMMMMDDTCPSWKLYENPFYINPPHYDHKNPHKSPIINNHLQFYCLKLGSSSSSSSSFCDLVPTKRRMDSELDLARSEIVELKTELRYERKARKKVEGLAKRLAKELDEERKQRDAMEGLCRELAREISSHEAQIDIMKNEIEDERKMLRLAEVLREERVKMKVADVKMMFEDTISELQLAVANKNNTAATTFSDEINDFSSKNVVAAADKSSAAVELENSNLLPINPHIMRGIKGFVEFRRVGVRTAKGFKTRDSDSKLDSQKPQLTLLLKNNKPIYFRSNNLINIT